MALKPSIAETIRLNESMNNNCKLESLDRLYKSTSSAFRLKRIILMAVVLVAGCSKLEVQAPGFGTDPDAVRVEASVGVITKTSPLGTPDEQVRFNDGDQIAVSNGSKTVKYKFDGTSWAPVADENGATDYLVWDTPVTFRAWYPASASWDKFSLPTDQSEDIAAADFMTCSAEYKDDAAIP